MKASRLGRDLGKTGYDKVESFLAQRQFIEAKRELLRILRWERLSPAARQSYLGLLASTYLVLGEATEALRCRIASLRLGSKDIHSRLSLASHLLDWSKTPRKALSVLKPLLGKPRLAGHLAQSIYDLAARLHLALGEHEKAYQYFRKVVIGKKSRNYNCAIVFLENNFHEIEALHRLASCLPLLENRIEARRLKHQLKPWLSKVRRLRRMA